MPTNVGKRCVRVLSAHASLNKIHTWGRTRIRSRRGSRQPFDRRYRRLPFNPVLKFTPSLAYPKAARSSQSETPSMWFRADSLRPRLYPPRLLTTLNDLHELRCSDQLAQVPVALPQRCHIELSTAGHRDMQASFDAPAQRMYSQSLRPSISGNPISIRTVS